MQERDRLQTDCGKSDCMYSLVILLLTRSLSPTLAPAPALEHTAQTTSFRYMYERKKQKNHVNLVRFARRRPHGAFRLPSASVSQRGRARTTPECRKNKQIQLIKCKWYIILFTVVLRFISAWARHERVRFHENFLVNNFLFNFYLQINLKS